MLHAFDDWKEGREEYPNDGKQLDFLKNLFDETYISDIVGRNNVRNKSELEEVLNILSSAIGSLTTQRIQI